MQFYGFFPQLIDQNIENIENFHVRALNGRRLSLENWLKSVISLISWMSVISLKSGDFIILVHQTVEGSLLKFVARNHWKSVHLTLNGTAFGWKN